MSTWTLERGLLVQRICEIKGEQEGPLSKRSLDERHKAKTHALLMDAVMRS